MDSRWLVAIALVAACGSADDDHSSDLGPGQPLAASAELAIVAHPSDDLLFMQPALYAAVKAGTGVTNVYVTTDDGSSAGRAVTSAPVDLTPRDSTSPIAAEAAVAGLQLDGLKAAYAAIAGSSDWSCGAIDIAGAKVEHCRLEAAKLSLVLLGYPDGDGDGSATNSLLHLWEGKVTTVAGVGSTTVSYTQTSLIAAVTAIIDQTAPTMIRTTEVAATHGSDDSDRMLVGALTVLATARSIRDPQLVSYRGGDNLTPEPANVEPAVRDRSADILARFAACATGCAACGTACPTSQLAVNQLGWLERSYSVAMQPTAAGALRLDTTCVVPAAAGANASLGPCASAPDWQLDADGSLRTTGNLCLEVFITGEIIGNTCRSDAAEAGRFFLDAEGHLWSGITPAPQDQMDLAHLDCVGSAGGRPRAGLCGAGRAPIWAFDP